MTSRNGYTTTWTSYNHPDTISAAGESVQFAYDQSHERWRAIYNGSAGIETTYFVGGLLEKVISVGVTDYRHFITVGGTQVAIYSRTLAGSNTLRYVREDHQGSLTSIINSDGTSYAKESFTAFGNRRSSCTWSGKPTEGNLALINAVTRHGYTWHTALGAMGLNDMNGRIQDAVTGRFLSADPTIPHPSFTQSYNRYSYVNNNPLSRTDPTGFDDPCDARVGGAAVMAGGCQTITITGHLTNLLDVGMALLQQAAWGVGGAGGDRFAGMGNGDGGGGAPVQTTPVEDSKDSEKKEDVPEVKVCSGKGCKPQGQQQKQKPPEQPCADGPGYMDRYVDFVSDNAINVGPYAAALAGGLWPKSLAPVTGGRPPLLGSTNPLTSVPRAFGIPGADTAIARTGAAGIGLLTVGIGFYDLTIELEGFLYAIPSYGNGSCPKPK